MRTSTHKPCSTTAQQQQSTTTATQDRSTTPLQQQSTAEDYHPTHSLPSSLLHISQVHLGAAIEL